VIAVAIHATACAGRIDRAPGGKPDGQAGWVPGVREPNTIQPIGCRPSAGRARRGGHRLSQQVRNGGTGNGCQRKRGNY
jgi:hypothetical protein